jgi:ATP-dependent Clp protease ATP-binding subunit ClpA
MTSANFYDSLLGRCGITLEAARGQVEEIVGSASEPPDSSPPFTPRAKKVLELSLREALQLSHSYIGTEHILLGLIREGEGVGTNVIERLDVDLGQLRQEVFALLSGTVESIGEIGAESRAESAFLHLPTRRAALVVGHGCPRRRITKRSK